LQVHCGDARAAGSFAEYLVGSYFAGALVGMALMDFFDTPQRGQHRVDRIKDAVQRACYHIRLERDYDEDEGKQGDWRCEECGKRFSSLVEAES
jgi:hypothetical protein